MKKTRRSPKAMKVYKAPRQQYHTFTRLASSNAATTNTLPLLLQTESISGRPTFTNTSTTGQNLSLAFRLDQIDVYLNGLLSTSFSLPNYLEFVNLFDEYCIKKVDVMVLPSFSSANPSAAVNSWLPWIVHAADYDDTSNTTATTLMQYEGAKYTQLIGGLTKASAPILRTVYPRAPMAVIKSTGVTTGQSPQKDTWINTANPNVQHFGFKMSLDDSYSGSTPGTVIAALNIVCRYHLAFRDIV